MANNEMFSVYAKCGFTMNFCYLVWSFDTGKCRRTFRHRNVVLTVDVSNDLLVSGCEGSMVKVWTIESATLIKVNIFVFMQNVVNSEGLIPCFAKSESFNRKYL